MHGEKKAENGFPFKLSRSGSLKGRDSIRKVLRKSSRFQIGSLEFVVQRQVEPSQLCVSLSRKTGKAHHRNRIKRQIREAFAKLPPSSRPLKVMVMGKKALPDLEFWAFQRELAQKMEPFLQ